MASDTLRRFFGSRTPVYWIVTVLSVVFLAIAALLASSFYSANHGLKKAALDSGQRLEYTIANESFEGNVILSELPAKLPPSPVGTEEAVVSESGATSPEPEKPAITEKPTPAPVENTPAPTKAEPEKSEPTASEPPATEKPAETDQPEERAPAARIPPQANPDITAKDAPPVAETVTETTAATPTNPAPIAQSTTSPAIAVNDSAPSYQAPAITTLAEDKGGPLAVGPLPKLQEKTVHGYIQKKAKDETTPRAYYARPFADPKQSPIIAIVITGLGLSSRMMDKAYELPASISFGLSPYAQNAVSLVQNARNNGHEILLELPLQPSDYPAADPGPHALLGNQSITEVQQNLFWSWSRLHSYVGLITPMDETFSDNAESMKFVVSETTKRGMFFLAGSTKPSQNLSQAINVADNVLVVPDRVIDMGISTEAIDNSLSDLEKLAKDRGYAVGVGRPYPVTMDQLQVWAAGLKAKGITLAPVSAIANRIE